MGELIEALKIFAKYMQGVEYPTHCSHDELHVCCDPADVSEEDKARLDELGFFENEYEGFSSYKFGSA